MTTTETLVKHIADALLTQLGIGDSAISRTAIASSSLPAQIKSFVLDAVMDAAHSEVMQLCSNIFRYDRLPTPVKTAFADALAETALLTETQLSAFLQSSVALTHELLTEPHQTFVDIMFENLDEQGADAVVQKLQRIVEYRYLVDVLLQYIERKQVALFSREKAWRLIGEIDRRLAASYTHDDVVGLFRPMYNFYALAGEREISIEILCSFSREKKLQPLLSSLELLRSKSASALNFSDVSAAAHGEIDSLLKKLTPLPALPKSLPPSFETVLMREVDAQLAAVSTPSEISPIKPNDEIYAVPINTSSDVVAIESLEKEPTIDSTPIDSKLPPIAPKRREEPAVATHYLPPSPPQLDDELEDLRVLIDDEARKKIIRRLFKGSEANYDAAIADLNQKKTWRESSLYIDEEIFTRYTIDEYSLEAVQFTDIVFNRYHRKS